MREFFSIVSFMTLSFVPISKSLNNLYFHIIWLLHVHHYKLLTLRFSWRAARFNFLYGWLFSQNRWWKLQLLCMASANDVSNDEKRIMKSTLWQTYEINSVALICILRLKCVFPTAALTNDFRSFIKFSIRRKFTGQESQTHLHRENQFANWTQPFRLIFSDNFH